MELEQLEGAAGSLLDEESSGGMEVQAVPVVLVPAVVADIPATATAVHATEAAVVAGPQEEPERHTVRFDVHIGVVEVQQ